MTCRDLSEIVTSYLEGQLSWWDSVRFQVHLGRCRGCRAYLGQMKVTRASLGKLPPVELPEAVRDEMLTRFRGWKREQETER